MNKNIAPLFVLSILSSISPIIQAGPPACDNRVNNTFDKLLECVTAEGVSNHLYALQAIADANGGNRASDTQGYTDSKNYVVDKLRNAGYQVQEQEFQYNAFFEDLGGSILEQISPNPVSYVLGTDFSVMNQTSAGDVTGVLQAVGPNQGPSDAPGAAGCDPADFVGFIPGNIALIQRGTCSFVQKADNAADAGASGVIIYNRGDRSGLPNGILGAFYVKPVPVLEATYDLGFVLRNTPGAQVHMTANVTRDTATTQSVLAETTGGNSNNVIMVGAHLDSVRAGAGINDNGTGSAAVLETALQMAKVKPRNKVRFAWWGAEEDGLGGSIYYLDHLSDVQRSAIQMYLNFDMLGSTNAVNFVLGGSDLPGNSAAISTLFQNFYEQLGVASKLDDRGFWLRSDSAVFGLSWGIPVGGVTSGFDGNKTDEEATFFGGIAGQPYDPCYHQACDDLNNVDYGPLGLNADAVAYATLQYAMNTSAFNALKGKGNFKKPRPLDRVAGRAFR